MRSVRARTNAAADESAGRPRTWQSSSRVMPWKWYVRDAGVRDGLQAGAASRRFPAATSGNAKPAYAYSTPTGRFALITNGLPQSVVPVTWIA
jgi:hypothetical protein